MSKPILFFLIKNQGNQCAMDGSWRVDRPQDVTHTGGCIGLGIRVPTVANGNIMSTSYHLPGRRRLFLRMARSVDK